MNRRLLAVAAALAAALAFGLWPAQQAGGSSTVGNAGPAVSPPAFPFDAATAARYQKEYAKQAGLPVEFTNRLGMTFVLIPPGKFVMGSPADEPGRQSGGYDETRHEVTLTRPFYLAKHEVTVGQFRRFLEATKHVTDGEKNNGGHAHDAKAVWIHRPGVSWRKPGYAGPYELKDEHPVVHVSHTDATAFCAWLGKVELEKEDTSKTIPTGTYCLPTEAQWEWACRAGSAARFWWGPEEDATGKVANVGDKSLKRVHPEWPRTIMPMDDGHAFPAPVGSYRANGFGLHDMLGNVWEFCSTRYGPYPKTAVTDPEDGDRKRGFAVRGGGWSNVAADVRCATRNADPPHFCHSNLGFRVALILPEKKEPTADDVLAGLREFYRKTARPDGSFQPGIDPDYRGMSDCAYSDLAAVTYAVVLHKTFGWKLPHEAKTGEFLLGRQKEKGHFVNVAGTVNPDSAEGRTYNTTQGLVALRALGLKPRFDALPVFDDILKQDYKTLPAYSTSFFPLAYLCAGKPIPEQADRGIRALMVQDETGYLNDHIAATFHASHYYRLIGEETPKSQEMIARILRDQKADGSWFMNMPSRDRHATFDAVFTLLHEGGDREDCRAAIQWAAKWALSCRNADGGFGHFPGSTSDADAVYFQVGTLVMAGFLKPADPLPADPHLLSWGHLMPLAKARSNAATLSVRLAGWVAAVDLDGDGGRLATGSANKLARVFDTRDGRLLATMRGHDDGVAAVHFNADATLLATGSYDHTAAIWDASSGKLLHRLVGHRGVVLSVAFSPDKMTLATASVDQTIKLWDVSTGKLGATLTGHKSWVNSLAYSSKGNLLVSGSSDGTVKVWSGKSFDVLHTLVATNAEVRSVAVSADDKHIAAGIRYGQIKVWSISDWKERLSWQGHESDVWSVAFSPDSTELASGNGDWNRGGEVKRWAVADGKLLGRLQHTGEVLSIAYSRDGKRLAAGAADKTVKVWNAKGPSP
jgi:geranylgeranyl transferase type-2 subunit beta